MNSQTQLHSLWPWCPGEPFVVNISKLTNRWSKRSRSIFIYSQEKSDDLVSSAIYLLCPAEKHLQNLEDLRSVPTASAIVLMTYFLLSSKDVMWVKTKRNLLCVMGRGCSSSVFTFFIQIKSHGCFSFMCNKKKTIVPFTHPQTFPQAQSAPICKNEKQVGKI